jgi:hypothetical protein
VEKVAGLGWPSVTAVVDLIRWSFPPDQGRRRLSPSCGVTGQAVATVLPSPGAPSPIRSSAKSTQISTDLKVQHLLALCKPPGRNSQWPRWKGLHADGRHHSRATASPSDQHSPTPSPLQVLVLLSNPPISQSTLTRITRRC